MNESLDLLFRIQTQGIDALDKAAGSTKAIGIETKYSSAELQNFSRILGVVTGGGENYRTSLDKISKSSKSVGEATAGIAKDLLALDKQLNKTADEAEKSAKRQQAALQQLGRAQEQATKENQRRNEAANALDPNVSGFGKGLGLGVVGLGVVGGIGLQLGRQAALELKDALVSVTTGYAEAARETKNFADRVGISVTEARRFEQISEITGVSARSLEGGIRLVSTALEDQAGAGKKTADALHRLDIGFTELGGGARETGDVLLEAVGKLSKISDQTERAREATAILGRGSKELLPLIDQYAELDATLTKLGLTTDKNLIEKGDEAAKALGTLGIAVKALRDELGKDIAPTLIEYVARLTAAVAGFQQGRKSAAAFKGGTTDASGEQQSDFSLFSNSLGQLNNGQRDAAVNQSLVGSGNETSAINARVRAGGKVISDQYRASYFKSKDGIKDQIRALESGSGQDGTASRSLADLRKDLLSGELGETAAKDTNGEIKSREGKIDSLNAQLKDLSGAVKDAAKLERERLAEIKRSISVAHSLSGAGETPQERLHARADQEREALATGVLKGPDLQAARGRITTAELIGIDRENQKDAKKKQDAADKRTENLSIIEDEAFSFSSRLAKDSARERAAAGKDEEKFGDVGGITSPIGRLTKVELPHIEGATSKDLLKQTADDAKRNEKLLEITSRPGQELETQRAVSQLRLATAEKVYALELNIAKLKGNQEQQDAAADDAREKHAQAVKDIHEEDALKQAEAQKQNAAEARGLASGLTEAAFGGSKNVRGFFASQGKQLVTTAAGNLAGPTIERGIGAIKNTIPGGGILGTALAGTILDPNKGKGIDGNTKAVVAQTTSTERLITSTDNLAGTIGGGGAPGAPGGAGAGGAGINVSGFSAFLPSGAASAISRFGSLFAGTPLTGSGEAGKEGSAIPGSPNNSSGEADTIAADANKIGSTSKGAGSTGAKIADIAQIAAGAAIAYNGFKKGGAKGAVEGSAGVLETAAGVASLIPGGQLVGAVLGAVGGVVGVIGSLLGDPKQQYEHSVSKLIQQDTYQAPTSISKSMGLNGNYSDVDGQGNARSSNLSAMPQIAEGYYDWQKHVQVPGYEISPFGGPNTNPAGSSTGNPSSAGSGGAQGQGSPTVQINVSTMDSKSFMDNSQMIAAATLHAVTAGPHPLIDELRSQLTPGYSG